MNLRNLFYVILWIDGNHENFDRLYSDEFPVLDFQGGKVHQIRDNVLHLMRGHVFTLQDHTFFAFGGASSHDVIDGIYNLKGLELDTYGDLFATKSQLSRFQRSGMQFRINHLSWWKEELPNDAELARGKKSLEKHHNSVDFVLTHCAPKALINELGLDHIYPPDVLTEYLQELSEQISFKKWFLGHYHFNRNLGDKYIAIYEQIIQIL